MPKATRESDSPTVLERRESRSHGEGADRDTEPVKETRAGHAGSETNRANLPTGDSEEGG
jgi:hypothetical protein